MVWNGRHWAHSDISPPQPYQILCGQGRVRTEVKTEALYTTLSPLRPGGTTKTCGGNVADHRGTISPGRWGIRTPGREARHGGLSYLEGSGVR